MLIAHCLLIPGVTKNPDGFRRDFFHGIMLLTGNIKRLSGNWACNDSPFSTHNTAPLTSPERLRVAEALAEAQVEGLVLH